MSYNTECQLSVTACTDDDHDGIHGGGQCGGGCDGNIGNDDGVVIFKTLDMVGMEGEGCSSIKLVYVRMIIYCKGEFCC